MLNDYKNTPVHYNQGGHTNIKGGYSSKSRKKEEAYFCI